MLRPAHINVRLLMLRPVRINVQLLMLCPVRIYVQFADASCCLHKRAVPKCFILLP
jgi:hypothetical protein